MFGSFDISASALTAQRIRLETISSNIANINTTHDANNQPNPYRRLYADFQTVSLGGGRVGVQVAAIKQDQSDLTLKHEPWNPDADKNGNVFYPNVDLSTEYVNSLEASRAYEANATAIETTKGMMSATMRLLA